MSTREQLKRDFIRLYMTLSILGAALIVAGSCYVFFDKPFHPYWMVLLIAISSIPVGIFFTVRCPFCKKALGKRNFKVHRLLCSDESVICPRCKESFDK